MTTAIPDSGLEISQTVILRAAPERVWRALTEPDDLAAWFPKAADLAARDGATGWFDWADQGRYAVRIEAWEPPRRLTWCWAREPETPIDRGQTTIVEWLLEPMADGGTRLHLREYGFTDPEHHRGNADGWVEELAELAAYIGG